MRNMEKDERRIKNCKYNTETIKGIKAQIKIGNELGKTIDVTIRIRKIRIRKEYEL